METVTPLAEIVEEIRRIPVERFVADAELTFFRRGTDDDEFEEAHVLAYGGKNAQRVHVYQLNG